MGALVKLSTAIQKLPGIEEKTQLAIQDYLGNITNANTADAVEYGLRDFLTFKPIRASFEENFSLGRMQAYRDYLIEKGSSAATIRQRFKPLKGFCKHLVEEDVLAKNNAYKVKLPTEKGQTHYTEALTPEDVKAILEQVNENSPDDLSYKAALELLFTFGMRVSELTSLRWQDIHEDDQGDWYVVFGIKGGREHILYFPQETQRKLEERLRRWEELTGLKLEKDDYVLQLNWRRYRSKQAKQVNRATFNKKLKKLADKAGVKKNLHSHMARATVITNLLDQGTDLRDVMDIAGHQDYRTTKRYDNGSKRKRKEALSKLKLV